MSDRPLPGEDCYECGRRFPSVTVELVAGKFDVDALNWLLRRGWMSTDEVELVVVARRLLDPKTWFEQAGRLRMRVQDNAAGAAAAHGRAHKVLQAVWDILVKVTPLSWKESEEGYGWKCGACSLANRPVPGVSGAGGEAWADFVKSYINAEEESLSAPEGDLDGERL